MPLATRVLLMVCDGLRPDLVSAELMPRLTRLAASGVEFRRSHAVFPTVTRANSASLATGVSPRQHGIPGNELVADAIEPGIPFSTADARQLDRLRPIRDGHVLLVPTLADRVAAAGGRTAVLGTGSTGAALLQNPLVATRGDLLLHPRRFEGLSRDQIESAQGSIPARSTPNSVQNRYFTRLVTDLLLPAAQHDLIVFWHTDPDHTQHAHGLGHPLARAALASADENLGVLLDALAARPSGEHWVVVVTSDHGFSTVAPGLGDVDVGSALVRAGVKASPSSDDVVPVDGGVYVREGGVERVQAVAGVLRGLEGIGPLFTGGSGEAPLPGTIDRSLMGQGGELAPEVQYSVRWSSEPNAYGVAGLCGGAAGRLAGTHGSLSPFEVHNVLIMSGAGIKAGLVSDAPAGIVDLAPTLASLMGLGWDGACDGRILSEALLDGPDPADLALSTDEVEASDGEFRQVVHRSAAAGVMYVDAGALHRSG
jgi:arylsulfatase A-like enzyme